MYTQPTDSSSLPQATDNSTDTFLEEVSRPTIPAMDTVAPVTAPFYSLGGDDIPPPPPPPGNVYTPPPGSAPIFDMDDTEQEEEPGNAPAQPKRSADYQNKVIRGFIDGEEFMTSRILAAVAGTEDPTPFKYSEDDKNTLQTLMEPFNEWIMDKCPAALPLLLVYGGIKTDQIMKARKLFKTNQANKAAKSNPGTMQTVASSIEEKGERTNFVLFSDGYYRNSPGGEYIKRKDPDAATRLEKPHIKDLQKILEVKANNHADLLCAAFNWTEEDFNKKGIQLKN